MHHRDAGSRAPRRRARPRRRIAAVTALLALVLLAAACGSEEDGTVTDTSDGSTDDTTDGEGDGSTSAAVVEVVDRYIAAVADGDLESAYDLLAPRSQDAVGGLGGFEALGSALEEGIGAWSAAEEREAVAIPVAIPVDDGDTIAWAVTLVGVVSQEGPPAPAAVSLLVRTGGDGPQVSPFEDALGETGFVTFTPGTGSTVGGDDTLVVGVPQEVTPVRFALDDRVVEPESLSTTTPDGETRNWAIAAPGLDVGRHALTVVVEFDGALTSVAALLVVDEAGDGTAPGAAEVGGVESSVEVARAAFQAWVDGDDATLRSLTGDEAYATLTDRPADPADVWFAEPRCEGAAGSTWCSWRGAAGTLDLRVLNSAVLDRVVGTDEPPVVEARFG